MALAGVELEALVFETDALTTRQIYIHATMLTINYFGYLNCTIEFKCNSKHEQSTHVS